MVASLDQGIPKLTPIDYIPYYGWGAPKCYPKFRDTTTVTREIHVGPRRDPDFEDLLGGSGLWGSDSGLRA